MYKKIKKQIPYLNKYSDPLLWDSKLSSGASCFDWSLLRCFYNLIGVHLWSNQLIGHDYGPTDDSACQSKNQAMRSKVLSVELRDRIVPRHRSEEGYQKISAAFKVPKNTVASIILKWKMFETTKSLPRAGRPRPNWAIEREGPWSGRWPRTRWSLWQSSRVPLWESPQIQVCQACCVRPKKNLYCNRCQRCFNKVLSEGSEYLCKCDILV